MSKHGKTLKPTGFTIIELMVSIFVTLIALGTFFKLYTNSVKSERSINLRTSVAHIGDQIAESISAPIRLLGLNNVFNDWSTGVVIVATNGGSGTDSVSFRFFSPYGGPITKLSLDPIGNAPSCPLYVYNSASIDTGINSLQLMSSHGVYTATGVTYSVLGGKNTFTPSAILEPDGVTPYTGACIDLFPKGTLVTGRNNEYLLTYINGGANTIVRLQNVTTGERIVDFDNNANSSYKVPFFVFQFQREYIVGGLMRREWVSEIDGMANPDYVKEIKAIRFGFVMLSMKDRTNKKVATAGLATTISFCPFEGMCYSHNDLNKTAYVFRRLIHIKNFDYLQRNSGVTY